MRVMARFMFILAFISGLYTSAFGAVGCSLNDPDRDVKRIFPESSGYRTTFANLREIGGEVIRKKIEVRLGDVFDPVYENLDVDYAYYTILKGKEIIGRIHGVNQKGKYGGMQLILATDPNGKVIEFYYQKMSSPEFFKFKDGGFTNQFKDLTLGNFAEQASKITDPSKESHQDFLATLRGIKKNLILMDEFLTRKKE